MRYTRFGRRCNCEPASDVQAMAQEENSCCVTGLAIADVPMQKWQDIYEDDKALYIGTIFSQLDLPFRCAGGCKL